MLFALQASRGLSAGQQQCPLSLGEAVPVHSRLAGPQNQNKDWFDFGSKIPKSVVSGLEVVQQME